MRAALVLSVIFVIIICYTFQFEDTHVMSHGQWKTEKDEDQFSSVISKYLKARKNGLTHTQIAEEVFGVILPNASEDIDLLHSFPFLTGNTLMARADWVFSTKEVATLDWSWLGLKPLYGGSYKWIKRGNNEREMQDGDLIFVRSDEVEKFAKQVFPKLKNKFVLVTHNSDNSVPKEKHSLKMLEDPKLVHWFAQNAALDHPKLEPISIGIMRQGHQDGSGQTELWDKLLQQELEEGSVRDIDLYVNISPRNRDWGWDKMRYNIFSALKNMPFSHVVGISREHFNSSKPFTHYHKISSEQFLTDLIRSKFVLSPPGIGEDCFRTWESILLGAVPVVYNSTGLHKLWAAAPVLALDNMEDLKEEDLHSFGRDSKKQSGREVALAPYWFEKIDRVRSKYMR